MELKSQHLLDYFPDSQDHVADANQDALLAVQDSPQKMCQRTNSNSPFAR